MQIPQIPLLGQIDWGQVAEAVKTEHIVHYLSGLDPIETLTRPVAIFIEVVAVCAMLFFNMVRTMAVVAGAIAIWCAIVYTLPDTGAEELSLSDLVNFLAILLAVVVVWVYVFFVREN
jgi:hypothetical protein